MTTMHKHSNALRICAKFHCLLTPNAVELRVSSCVFVALDKGLWGGVPDSLNPEERDPQTDFQ